MKSRFLEVLYIGAIKKTFENCVFIPSPPVLKGRSAQKRVERNRNGGAIEIAGITRQNNFVGNPARSA